MKHLWDLVLRIRAERFFLLAAALFGVSFLVLAPPFQVPDEPNHFYRAWQVSEGGLLATKADKRVGGELPISLEKITEPFGWMMWSTEIKMNKEQMRQAFGIPLNKEERKFYDFNNTALYSPLCYLPAASGILIARLFGASPLSCFYAGRLFTLLFWIFFVYYAIRIVPVFKWLFALLALLPMSVFINMSINADAVTNASSFLLLACILNLSLSERILTRRDFWLTLIPVLLLASAKSAYVPLLALLFLIPKRRFSNTKLWLQYTFLLFFIGALLFFFWNSVLNPLYLSYENYDPAFRDKAALVNGADMQKQLHHILHKGNYFYTVLYNSVQAAFDMYFNGYIGMFGWLEKSLPPWFVTISYFLILLVTLINGDKILRFSWWQKGLLFCVFLVISLLVFLSQHLIWDLVGSEVILNIQGRYLIPFVPVLLLLFYNRQLSAPKLSLLATVVTVLFSLSYSFLVLHARYY